MFMENLYDMSTGLQNVVYAAVAAYCTIRRYASIPYRVLEYCTADPCFKKIGKSCPPFYVPLPFM